MSQPSSSWQWVWKVGSVKTGVSSWTRLASDGIMTHMRGTSFPLRRNVTHRIGSPLSFSHPSAASGLFACSGVLAKVQVVVAGELRDDQHGIHGAEQLGGLVGIVEQEEHHRQAPA